ncbi:MAG TPA: hypothetical protein VNO32_50320 [Candidatus Acidoferrum sp.]|nr:hypothetical protein [Candidatus Acidoferrum sp.]
MNERANHHGSPEPLRDATLKLLAYCESRNWAGVDPYDALNSRIFQALPILDRRIPRLILTQALKRSIFDIRPLLRVSGAQNPKALGLFLMSLLKLSKLGLVHGTDPAAEMIRSLESLRSTNSKYWCWGYSFPWQTRTLLVPRWEPNLVCTTFIANALLDTYEQTGQSRFLEMALSSARFILNELYWTDGDSIAGFAYPLPSMRNNVHNGNLLGAALFCRVARHTGEKMFIEPALKVARYSASRQHNDGSWDYGEAPTQRWIDNFHTGYNLDALRTIGNALETDEFEMRVRRGFEFYRAHFFREDGAARYFHDRTYPIDIHCVAQSIITLVNFRHLDPGNIQLAQRVLDWAMKHMWDEKGFFYYRVLRTRTIRTSYMRWSQAWMLLAMSTLLGESRTEAQPAMAQDSKAAVQSC